MTPIGKKELGSDNEWGLPAAIEVWGINIDAQNEIITCRCKIVTTTPTGVRDVRKSFEYLRFNSRTTDPLVFIEGKPKPIIKDNLKFDLLRQSQVGQMISGMIANDLQGYDGNEKSLEQFIFTDGEE